MNASNTNLIANYTMCFGAYLCLLLAFNDCREVESCTGQHLPLLRGSIKVARMIFGTNI